MRLVSILCAYSALLAAPAAAEARQNPGVDLSAAWVGFADDGIVTFDFNPDGAVRPFVVVGGGRQPTTIPEMWTAWCARCHAEDGSGRIAEPTVTVTPMDFTECKVATPEPDADWERAIAKGGLGVGLSPQMPAFDDSLTPAQITAFVSHLRGFCTDPDWPIGNVNFPRPILTEKAFPENEIVLLPAISHYSESQAPTITDGTFKVIFERRFGKQSMFELSVPLVTTNSLLTRTSGLGDIAIGVKSAAYFNGSRIISVGVELALPTGDRFKDHGSGALKIEPFVSAGMMIGGWYWQSQVKPEISTDTVRAGHHLVYNSYLGRDTSNAPDTWTLGVELNGEDDRVALTPQIRKGLTGTGAIAASFGMMLPLNKREEQGTRWVGYLLWEYLEPVRARR
jgi:hypothetical protein